MSEIVESAHGAIKVVDGEPALDWSEQCSVESLGLGVARITLPRGIDEHQGVFVVTPDNGTYSIVHTSDTVKDVYFYRNDQLASLAAGFRFSRKATT